ncbi:hypothetical protein STCU_11610 [Strigomonas culicis]|uniref:Uncharacterized protein n=1 Tax=Strigomonas culicis TaxID=28005 RepID=S9TGF7_9TRYP|nr:hypothetical protein STCU_11610 [Strigomonas culicis]|eukprot:EPY16009.1 hypothetical protein STCU_11610 [Strigomonas culicis]
MYCFRLEIIEVQPAELFARWKQEGIAFSIEAKLERSKAGCRFVDFPSSFEIRSTLSADSLYMGLRRRTAKEGESSLGDELYAEQREDFALSGELNPFGAVWVVMPEIGNEDNVMRANLMWEVVTLTNASNNNAVLPVAGEGPATPDTFPFAMQRSCDAGVHTSITVAAPMPSAADAAGPSMSVEKSLAELKGTLTKATIPPQYGGYNGAPRASLRPIPAAPSNPLMINVADTLRHPSAPVEVSTHFRPPSDESPYVPATRTVTSGESRQSSTGVSVALDLATTDSGHLEGCESHGSDFVCRVSSTETQLLSGGSQEVTAAPGPTPSAAGTGDAAGTPFLDYYAASTQVELPPGRGFASLYTVLAPAVVVARPDGAEDAAAPQRRERLLQSRIGDVGLSQRHAACVPLSSVWKYSNCASSALESLRAERAGGVKFSQATVEQARIAREAQISPAERARAGAAAPPRTHGWPRGLPRRGADTTRAGNAAGDAEGRDVHVGLRGDWGDSHTLVPVKCSLPFCDRLDTLDVDLYDYTVCRLSPRCCVAHFCAYSKALV